MIRPPEATPLADFTRDAAAAIRCVKETGQTEVLTVDGRPAVIVQDVMSYHRLIDRLNYLLALEGIRLGQELAARGETVPAEEVLARERAKYGLARLGGSSEP